MLICYLLMIAGFVVVGLNVTNTTKPGGGIAGYLIPAGLVAIAGCAAIFAVIAWMVDDEDLAPLQLYALILIVGLGLGEGAALSTEGDRARIHAGPSAAAVVIEVGEARSMPSFLGGRYQVYDLRLVAGDRREFVVTGAVGEFGLGERVEVRVDPDGILDPKLPRDTEPDYTFEKIVAAITVALAVATSTLLFIALWREY